MKRLAAATTTSKDNDKKNSSTKNGTVAVGSSSSRHNGTADRAQRLRTTLAPGMRAPPAVKRPDIGDALKDLPKEDRKALKAADEDRIKRRLEKKQRLREQLRTEKAKEVLDKKIRKTNVPIGKVGGGGGASGAGKGFRSDKKGGAGGGKRKTRTRSDNAVLRKNTKKVVAA